MYYLEDFKTCFQDYTQKYAYFTLADVLYLDTDTNGQGRIELTLAGTCRVGTNTDGENTYWDTERHIGGKIQAHSHSRGHV